MEHEVDGAFGMEAEGRLPPTLAGTPGFQIYNHIAAQAQVIEEQIDVKIPAAYFQMVPAAHEGKARTKL